MKSRSHPVWVVVALAVLASLPLAAVQLASPAEATPPTGTMSTLSGTGTTGQADGAAGSATFDSMKDMALSPGGDYLYVLEAGSSGRPNQIRKVDTDTGAVTTIVTGGYLDMPTDLEVDNSGDVWVAVKRPDVGGVPQEGIVRYDSSGGSGTVVLDGICCDYYNNTTYVGGAFTIDPTGTDLYYNHYKTVDGHREAWLYKISVASLPASASSGTQLAATGAIVRSSIADMEFAADGNLYVMWPGTGPAGAGYPAQLYRYQSGTFTQIPGNFNNKTRVAFSPFTTSAYFLCTATGGVCDPGARSLVRSAAYGKGAGALMAGGANGYADGAPGQMSTATGLALSLYGDKAYVADAGNHRIREIELPWDPNGIADSEMNGPNGAICWECLMKLIELDPVDMRTGNQYMPIPAVSAGGRGMGLAVQFGYNSSVAATDSQQGYGWASTLDMRLVPALDGKSMTVRQETGATVTFGADSASWYTPERFTASLTSDGSGGYTYRRSHFETFHFDSMGRLDELSDTAGNTTTIHYPTGISFEADYIEDAGGRRLTLTWDSGKLESISDPLTAPEGGPRTALLSYDGNGDLVSYTDLSGGVWTFTYDGSHRMLTMRKPHHQPSGPVLENHYDAHGRVDWQEDELDRRTTVAYDFPNANETLVTYPGGRQKLIRYDGVVPVETTDGYGTADAITTKVTVDPDTFAPVTRTDGAGNVTKYTDSNADGNVDAVEDATGRITRMTYNAFDQVEELHTGEIRTSPSTTSTAAEVVSKYEYNPTTGLLEKQTDAYGTGDAAVTDLVYADGAHPEDLTSVIGLFGLQGGEIGVSVASRSQLGWPA